VVLSEHDLSKKEGLEQMFNVSRVLVYYMYNYRTFDSDIMLLKVSSMLIGLFVYPIVIGLGCYKWVYKFRYVYLCIHTHLKDY